MSAHVLLNLSNELRKRDKMRGFPSILSLFATSLINSIIYRSTNGTLNHGTLKLLNNRILGVKTFRLCYDLRNAIMDVLMQCYQNCKPLVVYRFYCMALYHSQTRRHVIMNVNTSPFLYMPGWPSRHSALTSMGSFSFFILLKSHLSTMSSTRFLSAFTSRNLANFSTSSMGFLN